MLMRKTENIEMMKRRWDNEKNEELIGKFTKRQKSSEKSHA